MFPDDRTDSLRFRLSDDSGVLRFEEFEILNPLRCRDILPSLREYLVGRALADIDTRELRRRTCVGHSDCVEAVIREVQRNKRVFG